MKFKSILLMSFCVSGLVYADVISDNSPGDREWESTVYVTSREALAPNQCEAVIEQLVTQCDGALTCLSQIRSHTLVLYSERCHESEEACEEHLACLRESSLLESADVSPRTVILAGTDR